MSSSSLRRRRTTLSLYIPWNKLMEYLPPNCTDKSVSKSMHCTAGEAQAVQLNNSHWKKSVALKKDSVAPVTSSPTGCNKGLALDFSCAHRDTSLLGYACSCDGVCVSPSDPSPPQSVQSIQYQSHISQHSNALSWCPSGGQEGQYPSPRW